MLRFSFVTAACVALVVHSLRVVAPHPAMAGQTTSAPPPPSLTANDVRFSNRAGGDLQTSAGSEATSKETTIPTLYLLSQATGMFVAITKSGRVSANARYGELTRELINHDHYNI